MSGWRAFVALFVALDATTSLTGKRQALQHYFRQAAADDVAWAVFFLTGRHLRRPVSGARLRAWAAVHTGLPAWLVEESHQAAGDLAETLAILCARGPSPDDGTPVARLTLACFVEDELAPLASLSHEEQRATIERWWMRFDERSCFVAHKLLTGGFRVGVSAAMVAKGLAAASGRDSAVIEHRLMGDWQPSAAFVERLLSGDDGGTERSAPYPFFLASPLVAPSEDEAAAITALGMPDEWIAEWKWDGIRAQLLVRGGDVLLWSRGEELVTDRFPEIAAAARALPEGTVLDGEILPWHDERPLPFAALQTRIGRKHLTPRILRETPVIFLAFDLLEHDGIDRRAEPLARRREMLERLVRRENGVIRMSPPIEFESWPALAQLRAGARARGVEGIMLKRAQSPYRVGRAKGDWWKWKIEPYTALAVLVYAQPGHGRRASLYTDYTFAVWERDALIPVAKAYSGLTDKEILSLDAWIRANTVERFGPVRSVTALQVFELGFEGIQRSSRHKSGVAVRFPRVLRWRTDKTPGDAAGLHELRALIESAEAENPARPPRETLEVADAPTLFDAGTADAPDR